MPRFLIETPPDAEGRVRLRGAPLRHLRTVLRLAAGDSVELFDGHGRGWTAEIRSIGPSSADLLVTAERAARTESPLSVTLAAALSKGAKLDWIVEKTTELGVSRIVPFTAERTVVSPHDLARRPVRWRRLAASAAAQCGRTKCPEIADVTSFTEMLALAAGHDRSILFHEDGKDPFPAGSADPVRRVLVVTGPEGGFTAAEVASAATAGLRVAGLGPRVLRAETAAVIAVSACQLLWGDLGGAPRRF